MDDDKDNESVQHVCQDEETDIVALELLNGFEAEIFEDVRCSSDIQYNGKSIARRANNAENAEKFLEWMIFPVDAEQFYDEFWERKPFLIKRENARDYFDGWFSKQDIENLLESKSLEYGTGVDVTKYQDGERHTLNNEGVALPEDVWRNYGNGCSVRVLHPQRWSDSLWLMLSTLEKHWNCIAGCNVYLTPAGSQGFSPHYDDIEAFILQVEGKKKWKCYKPRSTAEVLPRFSSPNFTQEEIGQPILEVELEPGDLLFMPRGTIHQAVSAEDKHSLHITVSAGQRNTWVDYLEVALPRAIELTAEDHVELRGSLPRNLFNFMGVVHSDKLNDTKRQAFFDTVSSFLDLILEKGPWDSAADQLAVQFTKRRLPMISVDTSALEASSSVTRKITKKTRVKLTAPGIARLVMEEDAAVVYHMMDNSRFLHNCGDDDVIDNLAETENGRIEFVAASVGDREKRGRAENCELTNGREKKQKITEEVIDNSGVLLASKKGRLEFPVEFVEVLDQLMLAYPNSIAVEEIDSEKKSVSIQLVKELLKSRVLTVVNE